MSSIIVLREKDTLVQESGIFRFAQTLIARPKGRASRDDFSLKRRGACCSVGARIGQELLDESGPHQTTPESKLEQVTRHDIGTSSKP
jgi:hypothetical protein